MPTLLAVSVGGSCAPIVTAINGYAPDFVLFIVSAGASGSRITVDSKEQPCRGEPSIVAQSGLTEGQFAIEELTDPDTLDRCYAEIKKAMTEAVAKRPGWRRIADYTGGTKTMTAALVMAAIEMGWELSVVKGARPDLIKVVDGTEMASLVNAWEVRVQQRMAEARRMFDGFAYASAGELLESLLRTAPLGIETERSIKQLVGLCRAFDAWDRFDHQRAGQLLEPYQSLVVPHWIFLKTLIGRASAHGYEPVFDLLLNAERRAARRRYDDAVARLYRALELLAQIRLAQRQPSLDAGNVQIELLPEALREEYAAILAFNKQRGRATKVRLGLVEDYELLCELHDPVGLVYAERRSQLKSALEKRNGSILAHGALAIGPSDYELVRAEAEQLIGNALRALKINSSGVQFPSLDQIGLSRQ